MSRQNPGRKLSNREMRIILKKEGGCLVKLDKVQKVSLVS